MKNRYTYLKYTALALLLGVMLVTACKKEETLPEAPRLFRPVINGEITGAGNWLSASWTKVKEAKNYTAEISVDSFKTVLKSATVDTNIVVFDNLGWLTLYQLHVRANATVESKNSGFSFLGERKTEKFPSIMSTPGPDDILDKAILMRWTNSGAAVTNFKVTLKSNGSQVKDVPLTSADIANQYKVIDGLTPQTTYVVTLYSGTNVRGYETITTDPQIITGTNIVDITQETNPDILTSAYLASLSDGTTLILKRGMTYNIGSVSFIKKLTFVSEVTFFLPPAKFNITGNFNVVATSSIAEISFKTIDLIGAGTDGYASRYVFNINVATTIEKISFEDCKIKALRGVIRTQAGPKISTVSINKCLIDSIAGYGVVSCDNTASTISNVSLTNSTISDVQKVLASRSNATSVLIENCTFYFAPQSSNYFLDYGALAVTNGITLKNNIFGAGKPSAATPPVLTVGGFRPATINITSTGSFKTSDLIWTLGTDLPGLADYSGSSAALFKNPALDDFTIIDTRFAGKSTAGDPRWRP